LFYKKSSGRKRFFEKERGSVFALQAAPRQVGEDEKLFLKAFSAILVDKL
jgi:hypothetical protein